MNRILFTLFFGIYCIMCSSQNFISKNYLILTITYDSSDKCSEEKSISYFAAEYDCSKSLDSLKFYPLFIDPIQSDQYIRCCEGKPSWPNTFTTESKFDFSKKFEKQILDERKLLNKYSLLIQKKRSDWKDKYYEYKYSIALVKVAQCYCETKDKNYETYKYIYMPFDKLTKESFLPINKDSKILKLDFSEIN